jgi:hypothetical protein
MENKMVTVVKSEWHQVEKRYSIEIDESVISEIYPDKEEEEIDNILSGLEDGTIEIDEVIEAAYEEGVDLDFDWMDEDDWWTDRKGGYEVTYEVVA